MVRRKRPDVLFLSGKFVSICRTAKRFGVFVKSPLRLKQNVFTFQIKHFSVSSKTLRRLRSNVKAFYPKRLGVQRTSGTFPPERFKASFLNVEAYAPAHRSLWRRMPKHFPGMSFHCYNEIPKTLTIGKLTKHHRKQLIPTGIALDILAAFILTDEIIEMVAIHKLD